MWLTRQQRIEQKIQAGHFGKCGRMIIKPYSIPKELKDAHMKIFLKFVTISICGCWEWQGRIHNGYPCCPTPGGNTKWAHRVSYALFNGPIDEQRHVDHKCRNKICVRPDHLIQTTPTENYEAIHRRKRRDIKREREKAGQTTIFQFLLQEK